MTRGKIMICKHAKNAYECDECRPPALGFLDNQTEVSETRPSCCDGDCACDENFAQSENLKEYFEKNASMFDNFLCVETDKGNPKCKIQCPFCERV